MKRSRLFRAIVLMGGALTGGAAGCGGEVQQKGDLAVKDMTFWTLIDFAPGPFEDLAEPVDLTAPKKDLSNVDYWAHVDIGGVWIDLAQPIDQGGGNGDGNGAGG